MSALSPRPWRIALSPREVAAAPGRSACQSVDIELLDWLRQRLPNALPWCVPLLDDVDAVVAQAERIGIDALLLAGGGDVGAQPRREAIEERLLACAAASGWPVLAVCRGLQRLHLRDGGVLEPVSGHVGRPHALQAVGETVNSWHHYGFYAPPPGWEVLARADDGSIEAMRHRQRPWLGLMWHPEREGGPTVLAEPWLRALFDPAG